MSGVKIWEENVVIPTYGIGAADKNPMFLESRVYQGSSGQLNSIPPLIHGPQRPTRAGLITWL